ncbi:protein kinase [Streptomyces sp. NPDC058239]|uniref:serine/threonine-protein kinase n=1 Tax=Streptomyces sp. NPDC058239 TaxID=3346395 RepID=UPI0036EF48D3
MDWDNSPLPDRIGQYRIVARLGQGGMGQVYMGRSPGGMKVAVKVIRPHRADDAEFRRRFAREVQAARQVNSAYTAAVVDADPEADEPWLATVHVAGVPLDQALRQHGPWPTASVRALGAGLVEALSAIHAAGVVHRDLKPSNVILTSNGPRVIDFGISVVADASTMTAPGAFLGTPGFASPEQILDQPVSEPSDIFSLGVLLAHAATGHNPFGRYSTDRNLLFYRTLHEHPALDDLPADLRAVVGACLAKDPAARPTTAVLLRQLVEPTDDVVSVLGTDAWLPPPVAELAARRAAEGTGAYLRATAPLTEPDAPPVADASTAAPSTPGSPSSTGAASPDAGSGTTVSSRSHRAAPRDGRDAADRSGRRRAVPALTAAVVALVLLAAGGWWWTQREDIHETPAAATGPDTSATPKPSTDKPSRSPSVTASPSKSDTPSAGAVADEPGRPARSAQADDDDAPDAPDIPVLKWHCRSQWVTEPGKGFNFNPCVTTWAPGQVGYKVLVSSPTAQTVTVYYYLGRADEDPSVADDIFISNRQRCTVTLKPGETKECGPMSSRPQTPGPVHAGATPSPTSKNGAGSTVWQFDGSSLTHQL